MTLCRRLSAAVTATVLAGMMCAPASYAVPPGSGVNSDGSCELPKANGRVAVDASTQGFDRAKLDEAVAFLDSRLRHNVQVWRNNCLLAEGAGNINSNNQKSQLFSATKSVVSLAAGVAVGQGKLEVNAPISKYLPDDMGDAEHRAITVRDLLTQSAGIKQAIASETPLGIAGLDRNVVEQSLALPMVHKPGTRFEYSQRVPDLLVYIVQRAVGEDFQEFVQRELFTPIGISRDDYTWMRDLAGNTYGHAHLYLKPVKLGHLGLLMTNRGAWGDKQIIPASYLKDAGTSSATNKCYGYLLWVNAKPCISPSIPARIEYNRIPLPGLPSDAIHFAGFLRQNVYSIPSTGLTIVSTGILGDHSTDLQSAMSVTPHSEMFHEFTRKLAAASLDGSVKDPGPYVQSAQSVINIEEFLDWNLLASTFGFGPWSRDRHGDWVFQPAR